MSITGSGLRLMSGEVSFSISEPRASALERRGIWFAELEVLEDVLDAWREAVEVVLEVGPELLSAGPGSEVLQRELRGVVEGLTGRVS